MKIKIILAILLISPVLKAQESTGTINIHDITVSDTPKQNRPQSVKTEVMVNHEMIRRFQEVKANGDIYSWSQLLFNNDSRAIKEFMLSYRDSNLNDQSMEDIKLALEEKFKEVAPIQSDPDDEYLAGINRIKQGIRFKLGSGNQVAMK